MENLDENLSRRLEEEITLSDKEDDINIQTLINTEELDAQVETQNSRPTHPTFYQVTREVSDEERSSMPDPPSTFSPTTTQYIDQYWKRQDSQTSTREKESLQHPTTKDKPPTKKQEMLSRELKRLESHNPIGIGESSHPAMNTRRRKPTLNNLQVIWQGALETIKEELTDFQEQRFEECNTDELLQTDVSPLYRKLGERLTALECSTEDYVKSRRREGHQEEPRIVEEETRNIQTQITNIRLTYNTAISVTTMSTVAGRIAEELTHEDQILRNNQEAMTHYQLTDDPGSKPPPQHIPENLHPGSDMENQQMYSSATEWDRPSSSKEGSVSSNHLNILSTVVSSTQIQPITSLSNTTVNRVADNPYDQPSNTRTISTLGGNLLSTFSMPPRTTPHTHVVTVTCHNPTCTTNTQTNTQGHFHVGTTQQIAGTPELSHIL